MSQPITDARGAVIHFSNGKGKPLCRPHTRVAFISAALARDASLCPTCAARDLRARYDKGER